MTTATANPKPTVKQRIQNTSRAIRSRWSAAEQTRRQAAAETMQAQLALLLAIGPQPALAVAPARRAK